MRAARLVCEKTKSVDRVEKTGKKCRKQPTGTVLGCWTILVAFGTVIVTLTTVPVPTVQCHLDENLTAGTTIGILFARNYGLFSTKHNQNTLLT